MILQNIKLQIMLDMFFCPLRRQTQLEQIGQKIQKARPACHSVHELKVDMEVTT